MGFDPLEAPGRRSRVVGNPAERRRRSSVRPGGSGGAAGVLVVSALPYHEAGADAVDEIALCLSTGARYLTALLEADLSSDRLAQHLPPRPRRGRPGHVPRALQGPRAAPGLAQAHGRDRRSRRRGPARPCGVLRAHARGPRSVGEHAPRDDARCSPPALGGADLVTAPARSTRSSRLRRRSGRRVARNTGLVLREGERARTRGRPRRGRSYYFDTLTDALARAAWSALPASRGRGRYRPGARARHPRRAIRGHLARTRRQHRRRGKTPVLGVSEFANLDEALPSPPRADIYGSGPGLRRDAAPFEALGRESTGRTESPRGTPRDPRLRPRGASSRGLRVELLRRGGRAYARDADGRGLRHRRVPLRDRRAVCLRGRRLAHARSRPPAARARRPGRGTPR